MRNIKKLLTIGIMCILLILMQKFSYAAGPFTADFDDAYRDYLSWNKENNYDMETWYNSVAGDYINNALMDNLFTAIYQKDPTKCKTDEEKDFWYTIAGYLVKNKVHTAEVTNDEKLVEGMKSIEKPLENDPTGKPDNEKTNEKTTAEKQSQGTTLNKGLGDLNKYNANGETSQKLNSKFSVIVGIIQTIGIILSVVILVAIGIKYMLASVEERANYKKSMIPYIIGAAILFAGSFLPQFIYNIVSEIQKNV